MVKASTNFSQVLVRVVHFAVRPRRQLVSESVEEALVAEVMVYQGIYLHNLLCNGLELMLLRRFERDSIVVHRDEDREDDEGGL